jgi:diadenosine tetraphosphate (Ap4A) HIT family hydrolase
MIRGKSTSTKVYEDEHVVAVMDIKPINQGHVLIVPKKHAELLTDLEDNIAGEMLITAKRIALALKKSKLRVKAVNYFMADGAEAGQEVFHAHMHIIPRYRSDGFYLHMPPRYDQETSRKELEDAATKIKAQL